MSLADVFAQAGNACMAEADDLIGDAMRGFLDGGGSGEAVCDHEDALCLCRDAADAYLKAMAAYLEPGSSGFGAADVCPYMSGREYPGRRIRRRIG